MTILLSFHLLILLILNWMKRLFKIIILHLKNVKMKIISQRMNKKIFNLILKPNWLIRIVWSCLVLNYHLRFIGNRMEHFFLKNQEAKFIQLFLDLMKQVLKILFGLDGLVYFQKILKKKIWYDNFLLISIVILFS